LAVWFQLSKWFQRKSILKHFPGMIIGRSSTKFLLFMLNGNPRWLPPQDIDKHWTLWENIQMPSSQKLQIWLKGIWTFYCRGPSNDHSWVVWFQLSLWFQRRSVLKHFPIGFNVKLSRAVAATLDPMGKCSNAFFSETTNMIKAKLYKNVHWNGPLQNICFLFWYEIQNGGYGRT
jgi:hypothetical protein